MLTPAWPAGQIPNGIATYAGHIVPALREKGVDVFVVTSIDGSDGVDSRVSVPRALAEPVPQRALRRLYGVFNPYAVAERRNALTIVREIDRVRRERGIDLIEMEESFGWCEWVASECRVPVVARLHGPWFLNGAMVADPRTRSFRRRVRREGQAIGRVAGVSAPSRDVLERTRRHYGMPLADAVVIPNPVPAVGETERWDSAKCESATLLFVGRFDRHKGGDVAIEAFARIRRAEPSARLLFAGPDSGVTDEAGRTWHAREFIADRLPKPEDREAVEWLGPQSPAVIHKLRMRAAVTVVCSRWEVFGYTLTEAMSQACPVVATATGGLAEIVDDGRNGLLARPADPDDLARAVLELLRDPARAARLARAAAETTALRFGPAAVADETLALYRRVLGRSA